MLGLLGLLTALWHGAEERAGFVRQVKSIQERFTLGGHTARINGLASSRDGTMLATASSDDTVRLWDATPDPGPEP